MHTQELTLTASGRLHHNVWRRGMDGQEGCYEAVDVTDHAEVFLFEGLELAPDVTLRSVFELVMASPGLRLVLRRHRAQEISLEGLAEASPSDAGIDPQDIEYVCVYRSLERNTKERALSGFRCDFHGVGPVLEEDVVEGSHVVHSKGSRITYAFSLTSPQRIRDLPLKLDTELCLYEGDTSVERYWEKTERLQSSDFTLGDVLDAIFWELTYYGVGTERDDLFTDLKALSAALR